MKCTEQLSDLSLYGKINGKPVVITVMRIIDEGLKEELNYDEEPTYEKLLGKALSQLSMNYPLIEWSSFKPLFNAIYLGEYTEDNLVGSMGVMVKDGEIFMVIFSQEEYNAYQRACDIHKIPAEDRATFIPHNQLTELDRSSLSEIDL